MTADLILYNGRFSTLDRSNASPDAVAIADGRFISVGHAREVEATAGATTKRIDLQGRRVIPGLIDSHMHIIRGGLNYNLELRWMACARCRRRLRCSRRKWIARRRHSGCASSADSPNTSLRRNGSQRLTS